MTMTLIEMDGFLRGKCLPGDMKVNETNAGYLVRKFAEAEAKNTALTSQLESVVAENAALKVFGDKLNDMHNDLNGEGTGIQGRAEVACQQVALEAAMEEFDAIKTPVTDAFLAEVRASGVEMFAASLKVVGPHEHPYSVVANEFAAKLRLEAK